VLASLIGYIGANACLMAAFSGFNESHEPFPSGNAHGIVPQHQDVNRNSQQSGRRSGGKNLIISNSLNSIFEYSNLLFVKKISP
jgi:hypothetical protein